MEKALNNIFRWISEESKPTLLIRKVGFFIVEFYYDRRIKRQK
jgi:hypothetical protein